MVQMCNDKLCIVFTGIINECLGQMFFPDDIKKKLKSHQYLNKNSDMDKNNYRPVSIFTVFDKVFETIIASQLNEYFKILFNKMLCAYRKAYGCEHILIKIVDKWKWALDKNKCVGTVLMVQSIRLSALHMVC